MRKAIIIALGLLAVLPVPAAQAQQPFTFFASVVDQKGAPVTTLKADDFAVREGGVDAKITKVEPIDWPVKVQILMDNGAGVGSDSLQYLRNGVKGLVAALPDGVEMTLVATAPQPRTVVKPTTDKQMVIQGADRLTPDGGVARFSDALMEALDRVDKDKDKNTFPVIVILGSTAGDSSQVMDRDFKKMLQRIQQHAATVHVVMLSTAGQAASAGNAQVQTQVGDAAVKQSGGRYEAITAPSRIATLLPEIGKQIAASHARQSHQYRVTYQRPAGKTGAVEQIEMAVPAGMQASLTVDGHMP